MDVTGAAANSNVPSDGGPNQNVEFDKQAEKPALSEKLLEDKTFSVTVDEENNAIFLHTTLFHTGRYNCTLMFLEPAKSCVKNGALSSNVTDTAAACSDANDKSPDSSKLSSALSNVKLEADDSVVCEPIIVPISENDMNAISLLPTFGAFYAQRDEFSIQRYGNEKTVYLYYKNYTFAIPGKSWKIFQDVASELIIDFTYVSHYYNEGRKEHWGPRKDVWFLQQLTVAAGQYFYSRIIKTLKQKLCEKHRQLWSENHEKSCNAESTETLCYKMAELALSGVRTGLLSTILQCNQLDLHTVSIDSILDGYLDDILQGIHYNAYYVLSAAMVSNAVHRFPDVCSFMPDSILKECYACRREKHCTK